MWKLLLIMRKTDFLIMLDLWETVADPGGAEGAMAPPGPVKIGHKKDGRRRRLHRFHVSRPPPLPGRWIRYWENIPKVNVSAIQVATVSIKEGNDFSISGRFYFEVYFQVLIIEPYVTKGNVWDVSGGSFRNLFFIISQTRALFICFCRFENGA